MKKINIAKGDKEALLKFFESDCNTGDTESDHCMADEALISFIGDEEIKKAFNDLDKWYA